MGPDTIWIFIPLAGMAMGAFGIWTKHQRHMAQLRSGSAAIASGQIAGQQAERIRELEERVRVLEAIVTDRGFTLAREIEALRPAASDQLIGERA